MKPILMDFSMPITTERLIIRPPSIGDGIKLNQAILETYDQLKTIMPWAKTRPTVDDSEEFVRQSAANWILKNNEEPYLPLFIFDRETDLFLGATGYHHMDWQIPAMEIGYWLRVSYQKQGIMTEAINALTRYAFSELKLNRLEIRCDIKNEDSKHIPERLGYTLESTLRNNRIDPKTNQMSDTLIYVRHDLKNLPGLFVDWEI
jgi:RimJ/RimL family protein N-acetyltransferase